MLSHQKIEKITNGFAIVQINFDLKIIGLEKDLKAAESTAEKCGNLGYPCLVLPLPVAYLPQGHTWSTPNYK